MSSSEQKLQLVREALPVLLKEIEDIRKVLRGEHVE
jgi:hypothetical protein